MYIGLAESEASVRSLPCWVDIPGGVIRCPSGEDIGSSSGCGEPGGEWGKGYSVSLLRSRRMTKVGSGFHTMLCRLLGRRRERGSPGARTGDEPGMRVGQYFIKVDCFRVRFPWARMCSRMEAMALRLLISS